MWACACNSDVAPCLQLFFQPQENLHKGFYIPVLLSSYQQKIDCGPDTFLALPVFIFMCLFVFFGFTIRLFLAPTCQCNSPPHPLLFYLLCKQLLPLSRSTAKAYWSPLWFVKQEARCYCVICHSGLAMGKKIYIYIYKNTRQALSWIQWPIIWAGIPLSNHAFSTSAIEALVENVEHNAVNTF